MTILVDREPFSPGVTPVWPLAETTAKSVEAAPTLKERAAVSLAVLRSSPYATLTCPVRVPAPSVPAEVTGICRFVVAPAASVCTAHVTTERGALAVHPLGRPVGAAVMPDGRVIVAVTARWMAGPAALVTGTVSVCVAPGVMGIACSATAMSEVLRT